MILKRVLLLFLVLISIGGSTAFAQDGANDPTFNSTDIGFGNGDGTNGSIRASAIQNDGKILIGGLFTFFQGSAINRIARLNADGTIDGSFTPGTGAGSDVYTISLQADGKSIIGGRFITFNATTTNYIARLNTNGTLDATFNIGTGANGNINSTSIQADGKIIIAGSFTLFNGIARNRIARLNSDGSLDASFNPGTGTDNLINTIFLQIDGKIIIGGNFTAYNGSAINRIARLNVDGTLDASFTPGMGASNNILTSVIQPNGKIIIGGDFLTYDGTTRNYICGLNSNGTLDAAFNPGTGANNSVFTVSLQTDGKIIIGGQFTSYNNLQSNFIARINADGSLDVSFNAGTGANNGIRTSLIQVDGKILVAGDFTLYNGKVKNRINRVNTDGSTDAGFNINTGANNLVRTSSVLPDGKIIIAGDFTTYNGTDISHVARLNTDGSLDAAFNPGTTSFGIINTISLQADGKLIIGGSFALINGALRNNIARLNADGSLDATFDPGTGADNPVQTSAVQADGKIIIGGDFTNYNSIGRSRIARLNADGSLDVTFLPGTGASSTINSLLIQSDGKIIIGGTFITYNSTARTRVARVNADGSLDPAFTPGTGANATVRTLTIQPDGNILIGGDFTSYNSTARSRIVRVLSNGNTDATFNPGSGASSLLRTISVQADGKIIIGGQFTSYNGVGRNYLARLNANGNLDATFNPGIGGSNTVFTSAVQSDGKIIIGGAFTAYNGTGRNRVARVLATPSVVPVTLTNVKAYLYNSGVQVEWRVEQEINIEKYEAERSQNGIQFSSIGTIAATVNAGGATNYSLYDAKPNSGVNYYRIKITDKDGKVTYSIVMKVNIAAGQKSIAVYPNPVTGNTIGLQINNLPKGIYIVSISNQTGQTVATKKINHTGGSSAESVDLSKAVAAGIYHVRLVGEGVNITEEMIKK